MTKRLFFVPVCIFSFCFRIAHAEDPSIARVDITGADSLVGSIRKALPMKSNGPYDEKSVAFSRDVALSVIHSRGFIEGSVDISTSALSQGIVVSLNVNLGPMYRFGDTKIQGLESLPKFVVEKNLNYKKDDPYDRRKLFETQSRLYHTGLFDDVRVQASTVPFHASEITVRVRQKPLRWIRGGVGWGSEEKQRITLIFTHENLFHRAYKGELTTTLSSIWLEHKFDFINRYFFQTRTEQRTSISWRNERREGYDYERTLGEFTFGRALAWSIHGNLGLQTKRNIAFNLNPQIAAVTPDVSDSRSIVASFNRDSTNNFFSPSEGTRSQIQVERAGGFLGGSLNFNRVSADFNDYQHIWKGLVLATAFRSGLIRQFGPSEDVPIFERFFIGGANSVRGYRERGVGPHDASDAPLGGRWRLGATTEFRFPIFWKFAGATFIDGGQVGSHVHDVQPSLWRYGAGVGIRFVTVVGPIRLDYGYKLNRADDDRDPWRIHLSLGEAF